MFLPHIFLSCSILGTLENASSGSAPKELKDKKRKELEITLALAIEMENLTKLVDRQKALKEMEQQTRLNTTNRSTTYALYVWRIRLVVLVCVLVILVGFMYPFPCCFLGMDFAETFPMPPDVMDGIAQEVPLEPMPTKSPRSKASEDDEDHILRQKTLRLDDMHESKTTPSEPASEALTGSKFQVGATDQPTSGESGKGALDTKMVPTEPADSSEAGVLSISLTNICGGTKSSMLAALCWGSSTSAFVGRPQLWKL